MQECNGQIEYCTVPYLGDIIGLDWNFAGSNAELQYTLSGHFNRDTYRPADWCNYLVTQSCSSTIHKITHKQIKSLA